MGEDIRSVTIQASVKRILIISRVYPRRRKIRHALEQFSNLHVLASFVPSGFFLSKKATRHSAFSVHPLQNCSAAVAYFYAVSAMWSEGDLPAELKDAWRRNYAGDEAGIGIAHGVIDGRASARSSSGQPRSEERRVGK